jgi:plasmid stabilization system protein ParE
MSYSVRITIRAERDLGLLFEAIHADRSTAAWKWYRGLKKAVLSLEKTPNRCPQTPEDPKLRNLLYGRKPHVYRVIFRVVEAEWAVEILHIRHGARRPFKRLDRK